MFEQLKRWLSRDDPDTPWADVAKWARRNGWQLKLAKDGDGFVVDGAFDSRNWRLEWGPSQRTFIQGRELRIRMELRLPSAMQMMVMSRPLLEVLERETFERFTETTQTHIDVDTPEEMRWLAMFPKAPLDLPRDTRTKFGAVASDPELMGAWIDETVIPRLSHATQVILRNEPPFVLMTLRGRLYLRMQLPDPDAQTLDEAVKLFDAAAHSALRVAAGKKRPSDDWPSTSNTAWQTQIGDDASRER